MSGAGTPEARRAHGLVSIAVAAVFARAVPYPLQRSWDDGRFIVDNPLVREPSLDALVAFFTRTHFQAYHPLHLLSYWLDVPWAGASGPAIHATSLLLWVLAANVLLRTMLALGLSTWPAVFATLACTLHPAQVEAVSWATGRKDVLAMLFAASTIALHLRGDDDRRAAWGARACYLAGALSKTTVLPLPAVLWLADVCLRRKPPLAALKRQLPMLILGALLAVVVVATWEQHTMVRSTAGGLEQAPARVAATLRHQLGTALWPSANAPMYSTRRVGDPGPVGWLLAVGLLGALAGAWRRRLRRACFGLGALLILIAPVANAIPMYFPFQDRYLSLPLLALGFCLGAGLQAYTAGLPRLALGALVIGALGARTVQYEGSWRDEQTLWGHAAHTQPDAFYAWMKLGEVRRDAGALHGSIRAYRRAVAAAPGLKLGHSALLHAVALRDEALRGLSPSRAEDYARRYHQALDDAERLRALAGDMLRSGHLRALELPLARALELAPFPDTALERAARTHFAAGRPSVGAFYLHQMQRPTGDAALLEQLQAAEATRARSPL